MCISFVSWAFYGFSDCSFAFCGKTVTSLRRNVITPLLPLLRDLGFKCEEKVSKNLIEISFGTHTVKAEILNVNEYAKKDEAAQMYRIVDQP